MQKVGITQIIINYDIPVDDNDFLNRFEETLKCDIMDILTEHNPNVRMSSITVNTGGNKK